MSRKAERDSATVNVVITRERKRKLVRIAEARNESMTVVVSDLIDEARLPERARRGERS